jgi:hypothetical protein
MFFYFIFILVTLSNYPTQVVDIPRVAVKIRDDL